MQCYPSTRNTPATLYQHLLPSLNNTPLRANHDPKTDSYLPPPDPRHAQNYRHLALLGYEYTPPVSPDFRTLTLMKKCAEAALRQVSLLPPGSIEGEDGKIVRLSLRSMANKAGGVDMSRSGLSEAKSSEFLTEVRRLHGDLSEALDRASMPPETPNSAGVGDVSLEAERFSSCVPRFGRFRRDNFKEVEKKLIGSSTPDPILIPSVVTTPPPEVQVARTVEEAGSLLRRCCDASSVLLQQRSLVKNAAAIAAASCQHVLTVTLPFPSATKKDCFWRKSPMRRSTQTNLLTLLQRVCKTYQTATAVVQGSRGLLASRSVTFACAACIADAVARVVCEDDPSIFSLHYSGEAEGPTDPYSVGAGSFETMGCMLPVYDPNFASLRSRCLDYLNAVGREAARNEAIFEFDEGQAAGKGDCGLVGQIACRLALSAEGPDQVTQLISGTDGSLIEILPEFAAFRDVIFYFKHSVSGNNPCKEVRTL